MKKHYEHAMKSIIAAVLVFAMVLVSALSIPASVVDAAVAAPTLSKSSQNVLMDGTYKLTVKNQVKGSKYTWTSSNKNVATVSKTGVVTGVYTGTATITCKVKAPKKTYTLKSKITVLKPATSFEISNKITAMNLGQKSNLAGVVSPTSATDKVTWTSSNKKIATVSAKGVVTALKEGSVKITGKTLSGKTAATTIKVVGKEGVVTTQDELNALVGTGIGKITIKTDEKVDLTIPEGKNAKTKLVVDAPKADVHNNGTFASVDIKNIAANSWYEEAVGNKLNILALNARIVVGANANVDIQVNVEGAKLALENNGTIKAVAVGKAADINVSGTSKQQVPVVASVANIKLTSSVPLALDCKEKIELTLNKGAEGTKVTAASKDAVPVVKGEVKVTVTVGTGSDATQVTPDTTTTTPGGSTGGSTGGGDNGNVTPNVVKTTDGTTTTFTLAKSYKQLTAVDVKYNNHTYTIDGTILSKLVSFLDNDQNTIDLWKLINSEITVSKYGNQTVIVKGSTIGDLTKIVTFKGGNNGLDGKTFECTVDGDSNTVSVKTASGVTYKFTKVNDNKLIIDATNSTSKNVDFDVKF